MYLVEFHVVEVLGDDVLLFFVKDFFGNVLLEPWVLQDLTG